MSLPFDIDNYHKVFNKYPKCLMESGGKLYGWWYFGNTYKRKIGYWGEYPPTYLTRIRALFPKYPKILHLFGGTVPPTENDITVDINSELNPTVCCEILEIDKHFLPDSFNFLCCDPPYDQRNAAKYGYPLPNKRLVFRQARKVIQENGIMLWMDITIPIFRKIEWNLIGTIGLFTGTNRLIRVVAIFQASTKNIYKEGLKALEEK